MADRPQDQLDISSLLNSFSNENAGLTQRAIIAEERCKAKDQVIDELVEQLSEKERVIEQLQRDTNDAEPADPFGDDFD